MIKGYIIKSEEESKRVQNYLFKKGYRWSEIITRHTDKYIPLHKGKYCNLLTFDPDDGYLDFYVVTNASSLARLSETIKIITFKEKLRI